MVFLTLYMAKSAYRVLDKLFIRSGILRVPRDTGRSPDFNGAEIGQSQRGLAQFLAHVPDHRADLLLAFVAGKEPRFLGSSFPSKPLFWQSPSTVIAISGKHVFFLPAIFTPYFLNFLFARPPPFCSPFNEKSQIFHSTIGTYHTVCLTQFHLGYSKSGGNWLSRNRRPDLVQKIRSLAAATASLPAFSSYRFTRKSASTRI